MSPLGSLCPKLVQHGSFYFCGDYENRPTECRNNQHPFRVCPIGMEKLDISDREQLHERIDTGYAMVKYGIDDPDEAYVALTGETILT